MLVVFVVEAIVLDERELLDRREALDWYEMLDRREMLDECGKLDSRDSARIRGVCCESVALAAGPTTGATILLRVEASAVSGKFSMYSRITLRLVLGPSSVDIVSK